MTNEQGAHVYVTVGGSAGFVAVEGDGDQLGRVEYGDGAESREALRPSDAAWETFWQTLDRIDVWAWDAEYEGDTTDSYCGVLVERGSRRVEVHGPESGEPPRFDELLRAVSRLADREF